MIKQNYIRINRKIPAKKNRPASGAAINNSGRLVFEVQTGNLFINAVSKFYIFLSLFNQLF